MPDRSLDAQHIDIDQKSNPCVTLKQREEMRSRQASGGGQAVDIEFPRHALAHQPDDLANARVHGHRELTAQQAGQVAPTRVALDHGDDEKVLSAPPALMRVWQW
ncbi:MAG: hypothetical protein KIS79_04755 [Burkholderiales bacterium]|nr:hypothetical protein [Burkholderiales bacterium]